MRVETYKAFSYTQELLNNLNRFRNNNHLCDIKLLVGKHEIFAHKIVLSASCRYFRLMFADCFQESKSNVIPIHGVDHLAFLDVLNFIYTSQIELTEENVFNVMEVVDIFQLYSLHPYINHFLKSSLNEKNCLIIYATAKFRDYCDAANVAFRFIIEKFEQVLEQFDYNDLPNDVWLDILKSEVLNIPNEKCLIDALITWYEYSTEKRIIDFNNFLKYINISKIKKVDLLQYLEIQSLEGTELLNHIKNYLDKLKYNQNLQLDNIPKPRCPKYNNVIIVTGGSSTLSSECLTQMNLWMLHLPLWGSYNPQDESELIIPSNPSIRNCGTASNDNEIFILGGHTESDHSKTTSCYSYNVTKNFWNEITSLPKAVSSAAAAICNRRLYLTGGIDNNHEIFNQVLSCYEQMGKDKRWVTVLPMLEKRAKHELCSVNGILYALGGVNFALKVESTDEVENFYDAHTETSDDDDIYSKITKTVERYCPLLNEWQYVSSMIYKRFDFASVVMNEYIYVFGGKGVKNFNEIFLCNAERYNTLTDRWESLEPMPFFGKRGMRATVFNNRIYILGGADAEKPYNSVHCYSPNTDRWQYPSTMHFDRVNHSVATLWLPENPERKHERVCLTQRR